MAILYVTPDEIRKTWITQLSTSDEPALAIVCIAASAYVENWTNRRFWTSTADEVRSFDSPPSRVWATPYRRAIPYSGGFYSGWQTFDPGVDLASVTTLELAESSIKATSGTFATISTGDYYLQPADRPDGWPATYIALTDEYSGTYNSSAPFMWFQWAMRGVRITGKFGWNTTTVETTNFPQEIRMVTAEVATYLWKSRESGFSGIAGTNELGMVTVPRVLSRASQDILEKYRRPTSR